MPEKLSAETGAGAASTSAGGECGGRGVQAGCGGAPLTQEGTEHREGPGTAGRGTLLFLKCY